MLLLLFTTYPTKPDDNYELITAPGPVIASAKGGYGKNSMSDSGRNGVTNYAFETGIGSPGS